VIFDRTELTGAKSIDGFNNMLVAIGNGSFVTGSGDEIPHPPHRRIRSWSTGAGDRLFGAQRASAGGRRLTLREAKKLLGAIQQRMVEQQVEEYLETQRSCPHCGRARGVKGSHTVMFPIVILLRTALPPQDAGSELTGTGCHGTRKLPG